MGLPPLVLSPALVSGNQMEGVCLLYYGPWLHILATVEALQEAIDSYNTPWFWQTYSGLSDIAWLAEALTYSTLIGVTDGSYMHHLDATATSMAYILICTSSGHSIAGSFAETLSEANACRGELLGLLVMHLLLEQALNICGHPPHPILVYSNFKSAIHKIHQLPTKLHQFDILKFLCFARLRMSIPPVLLHVCAHQDEYGPFHYLPLFAQLNCECDKNSKNDLLQCICPG